MVDNRQIVAVGFTLLLAVGGLVLATGALADAGAVTVRSATQLTAEGFPGDAGQDAPDGNETVENVTGTLEATGGEDYRLGGLRIDVGAAWYVNNTDAPADFDGDGTVETIRAEFDGLAGQEVTLTVESDGEEGDVLAVDGAQYREQGPPPWAGGPHGTGPPDEAGN